MKKGEVRFHDVVAGYIEETTDGYAFQYTSEYLQMQGATPVSMTLPLQQEVFTSHVLFPFFDGLIPEGWLLDIASQTWKINPGDRMELLLTCCKDCIGAVSIHRVTENAPQ